MMKRRTKYLLKAWAAGALWVMFSCSVILSIILTAAMLAIIFTDYLIA